jgi:3-dehydrosphinganine reductase
VEAFRGARALVTGGSSGIGRAIAVRLVRAGAHVGIVARGAERLQAVRAELVTAAADPARRIAAIPADVATCAQAEAAVASCADALGGLDLVVNNAGVALAARFEETHPDAFRRLLEVNLLGTVYVTRAALPYLRAAPRGHVVNVSSLAGLLAVYGYTAYAASKYAVTGFSEALRQELRPRGIGVSVCFPPDTDTPQLAEENRTKPAETRALAGTAAVLSADAVASALLEGVARGRFWIVPGRRARLVAWAARHVPGLVRAVIDREVARVQAGAPPGSP